MLFENNLAFLIDNVSIFIKQVSFIIYKSSSSINWHWYKRLFSYRLQNLQIPSRISPKLPHDIFQLKLRHKRNLLRTHSLIPLSRNILTRSITKTIQHSINQPFRIIRIQLIIIQIYWFLKRLLIRLFFIQSPNISIRLSSSIHHFRWHDYNNWFWRLALRIAIIIHSSQHGVKPHLIHCVFKGNINFFVFR